MRVEDGLNRLNKKQDWLPILALGIVGSTSALATMTALALSYNEIQSFLINTANSIDMRNIYPFMACGIAYPTIFIKWFSTMNKLLERRQ